MTHQTENQGIPKGMPEPGTVFAGQLTLISILGTGATGVVFSAMQNSLQREVAVKILFPHIVQDQEGRQRFSTECQAFSLLIHPHIVTGISSGFTEEGYAYIVQEKLQGCSLEEYLQKNQLDWGRFKDVFGQVCEALAFAHEKGIVHRDLKPSNIFLSESGTVKLLDFGIAKILSADSLQQGATRTGAIVGSPAYLSPEQARAQSVDRRSDIYSLGVVMYESISGKKLYTAASPAEVLYMHLNVAPPALKVPDYITADSAALNAVLLKCLEKDASSRYQSVEELRFAIEAIPESVQARFRPAERKKLFAFLGVVCLLGILICACNYFVQQSIESRLVPDDVLTKGKKSSQVLKKKLGSEIGDPLSLIKQAKAARRAGRDNSNQKQRQALFQTSLNSYQRAIDALKKNGDSYLLFTARMGYCETLKYIFENHINTSDSAWHDELSTKLTQERRQVLAQAVHDIPANWHYERAQALRTLADAEFVLGRIKPAETHYLQACRLKEMAPDVCAEAQALALNDDSIEKDSGFALEFNFGSLARVMYRENDTDAAITYYKRLYDYVLLVKGIDGIYRSECFSMICDYGHLFYLTKRKSQFEALEKVLQQADKKGSKTDKAENFYALANMYLEISDRTKAEKYVELAISAFQNIQARRRIAACFETKKQIEQLPLNKPKQI